MTGFQKLTSPGLGDWLWLEWILYFLEMFRTDCLKNQNWEKLCH